MRVKQLISHIKQPGITGVVFVSTLAVLGVLAAMLLKGPVNPKHLRNGSTVYVTNKFDFRCRLSFWKSQNPTNSCTLIEAIGKTNKCTLLIDECGRLLVEDNTGKVVGRTDAGLLDSTWYYIWFRV